MRPSFNSRQVDEEIVSILRNRFEHCVIYETPDHVEKCKPLLDTYEEASTNFFIKCKFVIDFILYHFRKTIVQF